MESLRERKYISQYAEDILGLALYQAKVPADADGSVLVQMFDESAPSSPVFSRNATHVGTGLYEVALAASESDVVGLYTVVWQYVLDGNAQEYRTYLEIGQADPEYDFLDPTFKDVVDNVMVRFADLFDSPLGGPNLQTYFQTNWSRGRIAQLMGVALRQLNVRAQPASTYTIDGVGGSLFPLAQWGGLLEQAAYIECVKHLIRSYVEQPMFQGSGAVSRLDRRDYMDRWRSILADEMSTYQSALEVFKIAHMGFGRPKVLVSGGVYGRYGPTRIAGSVAARPRYWSRFY